MEFKIKTRSPREKVVLPSSQQSRIIHALQCCHTTYVDFTQEIGKTAVREYITPCTRGRFLIDIGCGEQGGIAWLAQSLQAQGYLGIDINHAAVQKAQRLHPDKTFICNDPITVLENIPQPACIFSSGVCETRILHQQDYREQLITAIAQALTPGNYTIHHARGNFMENFGYLLEQQGLQRVATPWTTPYVFRKP